MKQMSIKAKVTLWYTCWMLVAVGLVVFAVFSLRTLILYFSEKDLLTHTVDTSLSFAVLNDGQLDMEGEFSFLQDGVYLSFYTDNGVPLYGRVPKDFDSSLPFSADTVQEITAASTTWLVYDRLLTLNDSQSFWARGVIAQSDHSTPFQTLLYLILLALPLLVILAAGMGYYITRRAFLPVTQIVDAAAQISSGNDLTRRINLGPGDDEIHTLAVPLTICSTGWSNPSMPSGNSLLMPRMSCARQWQLFCPNASMPRRMPPRWKRRKSLGCQSGTGAEDVCAAQPASVSGPGGPGPPAHSDGAAVSE